VDDVSVDRETRAGDPFAAAARRQAQQQLEEAVEAAVSWLEDRRRHQPLDQHDPRERRHRQALRGALAALRS